MAGDAGMLLWGAGAGRDREERADRQSEAAAVADPEEWREPVVRGLVVPERVVRGPVAAGALALVRGQQERWGRHRGRRGWRYRRRGFRGQWNWRRWSGGSGSGGVGTGGVPGPRILSIDFVGGITSAGGAGGAVLMPAVAMALSEIAGFRPAATWNGAPANMGSLTNLLLGDGTATTAVVSWNSPSTPFNPGVWRNAYPDAPGDARMMNGYLDPSAVATPATITVSGLPNSVTTGGYDVYVYAVGDVPPATTRTYRYAIGATTFTVSQTGPSPTTFPGFTLAPNNGSGNYVVFRAVTGSSFTLTATPGTGAPTRSPVNGLQIVSPAGS